MRAKYHRQAIDLQQGTCYNNIYYVRYLINGFWIELSKLGDQAPNFILLVSKTSPGQKIKRVSPAGFDLSQMGRILLQGFSGRVLVAELDELQTVEQVELGSPLAFAPEVLLQQPNSGERTTRKK